MSFGRNKSCPDLEELNNDSADESVPMTMKTISPRADQFGQSSFVDRFRNRDLSKKSHMRNRNWDKRRHESMIFHS